MDAVLSMYVGTRCGRGHIRTAETLYRDTRGTVSCRECQHEIKGASNRRRRANGTLIRDIDRATRQAGVARRRTQINGAILEYKRTHGCCLCGEASPECLDFHHIDGVEQDNYISKLASQGKRVKVLLEMAKCALVCANDHKRLHAGTADPGGLRACSDFKIAGFVLAQER